jgi:hypothetical protein
MKQTLFQNMLKAAGAFLFAVTMSAGFTACTDTIDNPATPVDPDPENERELVDPTPEPTEDAVAYTIDCSYAVFGNIDDEIGKAISRRLKGTPDVPSMAQLYFLDPQRGVDLGMGEEKWQELVDRTRSGEAALILSQCTFSDFYTFTKYYIQGMMELAAKQYASDDPDEKPDVSYLQAEAEQRMADALREGWEFWRKRQPNPESLTEPDWENIDSWPAELQDEVMFDAWGFHGHNNMLYVMNKNASISMSLSEEDIPAQPNPDELDPDMELLPREDIPAEEANAGEVVQEEQPMTEYRWGLKADAVARWIKEQFQGDAQTRAGMADFKRALTRADNETTSISELMSAYTKTYTFDYNYQDPFNVFDYIKTNIKPSTINIYYKTISAGIDVKYAIYSAHAFGEGSNAPKDYYQVKQSVTVHNEKLNSTPNGTWNHGVRAWVGDTRYNDEPYSRGPWMKNFKSKMKFSGDGGTMALWDVAPGNENHQRTISSETGSSSGWSYGGTAGYGAVTGSVNYSSTISFSQAKSWSTSDLELTATYDNQSVEWYYIGQGDLCTYWSSLNSGYSTGIYSWDTTDVPNLMKNTCKLEHEALMMVTNPTGQYKLTADLTIISMLICASKNYKVEKTFSSEWRCFYRAKFYHDLHSMEIDLPEMDRYKYKWHMFVTSYGPLKETESKSEFEKWLKGKVKSWQGEFDTAEASENDSNNAIETFKNAMKSLVNMKSAIEAYSGAGTYKFVLQRDDSDTPIETYTIIIE